jgi:hypothetical protein
MKQSLEGDPPKAPMREREQNKIYVDHFSSFPLYGQIDLNLEVCISNSHVYGTVTLTVTVTVNASHLHGNHLGS